MNTLLTNDDGFGSSGLETLRDELRGAEYLMPWDEEHFINANVPVPFSGGREITVSRPSQRVYADELVEPGSHTRERRFTLGGESNTAVGDGETDWVVVHDGRVSNSPIILHPLNHSGKEAYYTRIVTGSA